jgi:Ca2+-binding RTX toxin-like protein
MLLQSGDRLGLLEMRADQADIDLAQDWNNAPSNVIIGNNGPNILDGGPGNDTLYGLGGASDYFVFSTLANSPPTLM